MVVNGSGRGKGTVRPDAIEEGFAADRMIGGFG